MKSSVSSVCGPGRQGSEKEILAGCVVVARFCGSTHVLLYLQHMLDKTATAVSLSPELCPHVATEDAPAMGGVAENWLVSRLLGMFSALL